MMLEDSNSIIRMVIGPIKGRPQSRLSFCGMSRPSGLNKCLSENGHFFRNRVNNLHARDCLIFLGVKNELWNVA